LIQTYCLEFPGATEDYPWGDIVYKIKGKIFAGVDKTMQLQVTVKTDPMDTESLLLHRSIKRARYVGRFGWVIVTVEDTPTLDLACGLVEVSYGLLKK